MAALTTEFDYAPKASPRLDAPPRVATAIPAATFTLVRDLQGFDALEPEWNELFHRCGKPHQLFQSFAWNWHWTRIYVEQNRHDCPIAVLVGRDNGRIVTIWPLTISRRAGLTEIAWMGEPVSQYGDVLLDDTIDNPRRILREGWQHVCRTLKPDLVRLRKVRGDAAIAPLLQTLATLHTSTLEAPYVDLTQSSDFAAYEERFPTRTRRNRRRQMRRLEEAGHVAVEHLDESEEAARLAAEGIAMKRRWLIDRGHVSPALADARMSAFMAAVAADRRRSVGTRVSVLKSGDASAAIQIGFTVAKTRVLHVIAYDRAYEKMAAGVLHLEEAIRQAFDEGLTRIDLLAPKADYKVDWAHGAVPVIDHALGLSARGRLVAHLYLGQIRPRLKAAIERMPHRVRQALVTSHLKTAARRLLAALSFT